MSRYSGKEERKERTVGSRAVSGEGALSTSSSRIVWSSISRACGKYDRRLYWYAKCNAAGES